MRLGFLNITLICLLLCGQGLEANEQVAAAKNHPATKSPIYQVLASAIETRNQGQVNAAIAALNNALIKYPDQRQLQFELGSLYLEKGEHALAKRYFDICNNDKTITPRMRQALIAKLSQLPVEETFEPNETNRTIDPKRYHISQSLTVNAGYDSEPKVSSIDEATSPHDLKTPAFSALATTVILNSDHGIAAPIKFDATKPRQLFNRLKIRNSSSADAVPDADQYQNINYQLTHLYGMPNKISIRGKDARLFLISRFKVSNRRYQTTDDADLASANLNTNLVMKLGNKLRVSAELGVLRNEASNKHLATVIQFKPQLKWINTNSRFTLGMMSRDVAYKESQYEAFDGKNFEVDAAYRWYFNPNSSVHLGVSYGKMDRSQSYLSYRSVTYHLSAQHQFSYGTHLSIGARYSNRNYGAAPESSDQTLDLAAISESPLLLIGQLSHPINKYFDADLRYIHFQQSANYETLEREQYRFEFGLKLKL